MRLTNQRRIILEELKSVTTHPTADEIYGMVRQKMPRISLGTVYRNLEVLSSLGLVRKLENAAGQKRFDGDVSPHHHIRCEVCGKVGGHLRRSGHHGNRAGTWHGLPDHRRKPGIFGGLPPVPGWKKAGAIVH